MSAFVFHSSIRNNQLLQQKSIIIQSIDTNGVSGDATVSWLQNVNVHTTNESAGIEGVFEKIRQWLSKTKTYWQSEWYWQAELKTTRPKQLISTS